jgi:hypothetical protein
MSIQRIVYDAQDVYIEGERLKGVQSCTASWSSPETYVNAIGYQGGTVGLSVDESLTSTFDVEQVITSSHEPIKKLFESVNIAGEIKYGNNQNFAFSDGQITSYGCSCSVGSLPLTTFSILAFGNSGGGIASKTRRVEDDDSIMVATPGSLELDVYGHSSNAIQSFDISIPIEREPISLIGKKNRPDHFVPRFPIQVDCQFTLIVQDYESSNLYDFICHPRQQDLNLSFMKCETSEYIRKFFLPKARLVDFSQQATIDNNLEVTLVYKSLITDLANIEKIVSGIVFY